MAGVALQVTARAWTAVESEERQTTPEAEPVVATERAEGPARAGAGSLSRTQAEDSSPFVGAAVRQVPADSGWRRCS